MNVTTLTRRETGVAVGDEIIASMRVAPFYKP